MFTGIVTHTTSVKSTKSDATGLTMRFIKPRGWDDLTLGESINTNGACLTVAAIRSKEYECFLMPETLKKTSFGRTVPSEVNLERALGVGERFGGHFVQGHVDGVGTVKKIDTSDGWRLYIEFPEEFRELVVPKGSIAINGVSMTIAELDGNVLAVAVIPHTLEHTTLDSLLIDDAVNLEFDMIGKYTVSLMKIRNAEMEAHAASTKSN